MRIRINKALLAAAAAVLCACTGFATKLEPAEPMVHTDVAYDQFVLSADGKQPYNLSSLQRVPAECGAVSAQPQAGGVAILATLATNVAGALASAIVSELRKYLDAKVAEYAFEVVGQPKRLGFYEPALWFSKKPGAAERYSCFVLVLSKCAATEVDKDKGTCAAQHADVRVVIVGQYKLTGENLQIRPLFGQVKGFEAKRDDAEPASIAASLQFDTVWWDGHQGHYFATPRAAPVLAVTFKPTAGGEGDTGVDLVLQHRLPTGGYDFEDWAALPLLERPPQSPDSAGTVNISPTLVECNPPPELLILSKKLLDKDSDQISAALKNGLQKLVPKQ